MKDIFEKVEKIFNTIKETHDIDDDETLMEFIHLTLLALEKIETNETISSSN